MESKNSNSVVSEYDVAICGAGLAGLTLARQLKMNRPELSVVLIDVLARPLPEATLKVGESLVETGSYYLAEILDLKDYFQQKHLRKMGFRFFFRNGGGQFQDRPEFGLSEFPGVNSYQIDRGILENDLRDFVEQAGVKLYEGYAVKDVALSEVGGLHQVLFESKGDSRVSMVQARWVIDAMGRRRFLQKKLALNKALGEQCSAAWFRLEGRIDVDDLVPDDDLDWHNRVPGGNRYYSTNHLMGKGYWVWLIPLASGNTSVGIVAHEDLHPFDRFNTYERAYQWLQQHEPEFAALVQGMVPLDFRVMRRYSYTANQILSKNRWACVGEAAVFPDPFYALGTELIAITNSTILELIGLDMEGNMTDEMVEQYDKFILSLTHWLTKNIQLAYPIMGEAAVMACKIMWDTAGGWSALGPRLYNGIFLDHEGHARFRKVSGRFFFLTGTMQKFFVEWAEKTQGRCAFQFLDFLKFPLMKQMQMRNLKAGKSVDQVIEDQMVNMEKLEEFAQAIFLIAVEDLYPERLAEFKPPVWLNAWAISLDPERWEKDGLYRPTTEPREAELHTTWQQLRAFFQFESIREKVGS